MAGSEASAEVAADVGEVVVTAQRRAEPVSTVPISMTALTARQLDERSINRLPQAAAATSGVQVQMKKGAGLPNFVIRGAGLLDYNPNNSPPAALYIDEVYQPSAAMGEIALVDLERLEILKGPQGGLYGRDTSAGAIHVLTRRPEFGAREGYASFGFGRWSRGVLEGAATLALADSLALRVTAFHEGGDGGWQKSLPDGRAWGAPDRSLVRLQLRAAPAQRLDVNLKVEAGWDGSETVLGRSIPIYTAAGGVCAAMLQGVRDESSCLTLSQMIRGQLRLPATPSASTQSPDGSSTLSRAFNTLGNRTLSATASATYAFDGAVLSSVTSLGRMALRQNSDFAASYDRLSLQTARTVIDTFTHEFRMTSTGEGQLRWLAGAIWAEDDLDEARSIDMRDNVAAQRSLVVPDPAAAFLQLSYDQKSRYAAIYGQLGWRFNEAWGATADLRYSDQTKRYRDGFVGFSRPYLTRLDNLNSTYTLKARWSGKATLDWTPRDGALGYVSVARGYKSGGVFGGFNQIAGQVDPYLEETVWSYEAGFKTRWFDRRLDLNGAAFHYDYADVQGFVTQASPAALPATYALLTNLGGARHDGIEMEATLRPVTGLVLQGGFAWLNARFSDTTAVSVSPEGLTVPLQGRPRPFAPRWSGFALARYEASLSPTLGAALQVDANSRTRMTFPVTPVERALGGVPGYTLVNARLSLDLRSYGVQVSLWTTNLTDERYRLDIGSDGLGSYTEVYGEPRSYGFEVVKRW